MTGPCTYNPADWKPGDVAMFRVERWSSAREWPDDTSRVAMRLRKDGYWAALKGDPAAPFVVHAKSEYLHLLVELDPESDEDVTQLRKEYDRAVLLTRDPAVPATARTRTEALRAALRAMTRRPPKPDEPTGLGAVVRDRSGDLWVRMNEVHFERLGTASGNRQTWGELDVPPDGVKFGGVS